MVRSKKYPDGYLVKALFFWLQLLAISIPLFFAWMEYNQKPALHAMADSIVRPIIRMPDEGREPVPRSELVLMFNHIDKMIKKLEMAEQRREIESKALRNEKTLKWLMISASAAILLRILSYFYETRLAFARFKKEKSV